MTLQFQYPFTLCSSYSFTIESQTDATRISECQRFMGDLYIRPYADVDSISLEGLQAAGSIYIDDPANLRNISSSTLRIVQVTLPKNVKFYSCNFIRTAFFSGYLPEIGEFDILHVIDNPGLRSVKVSATYVSRIWVQAHENSTIPLQVEFPTLSNCSWMEISGVARIKLPKLIELDNLTLASSQASTVSIPMLRKVTDYIEIYKNGNLKSLSLPNLKSVGKGLDIYGNNILKEISLPRLAHIGQRLLTDEFLERYFIFSYLCITNSTVLTIHEHVFAFSKGAIHHEYNKKSSIELYRSDNAILRNKSQELSLFRIRYPKHSGLFKLSRLFLPQVRRPGDH
ncbi:hypothetical protein ACMFMF_006592 [Clarireedia jacksonii]